MEQKKSVGLAVASMVLGIVSLVFACCIPYVPVIAAIVGLILGIVSLKKNAGGKGMAIAGVVCSIIALIPAVLIIAGVGSAIGLAGLSGL